jgi:hypothetical protein
MNLCALPFAYVSNLRYGHRNGVEGAAPESPEGESDSRA